MTGIERIVVRAPNWIGDVVLSLPAVRDLRRNFPAARIEVLARPWVADLYGAVAEVDAVRPSAGVRADAASLRGAFDAAVLLPNSFASALAPWQAGIPRRWGYGTDGRGPLLTRSGRVPSESVASMLARFVSLPSATGASASPSRSARSRTCAAASSPEK